MSTFHPDALAGFGASPDEAATVAAALEILARVEGGLAKDLGSGRVMTDERKAADRIVLAEAHAERAALQAADQTPGMLAELRAAYPPVAS